jgi:hypothetical protein
LGACVDSLPGKKFQVSAPGAKCHHLEKVGSAVDHFYCLGTDGTRGPEENDPARLPRDGMAGARNLHGLSIPHCERAPSRCRRFQGRRIDQARRIDGARSRRSLSDVDWVGWFDAPDYWIAREVLQRGIAAVYVIAFLSGMNQFPALLGEHGLLPAPRFLERYGRLAMPTLFRWRYSDRLLRAVCLTGMAIAVTLVAGLPQLGPPWLPMIAFLSLWLLYMSIVNVGQTFYSFGWEILLLEAGFTVAFLGSNQTAPPKTILILLAWLLFRLEFGAGMIKIRGGNEWRDLTALYYHHETQPMPGPLSRQAHLLPKPLHKMEVLGNHFAQLVVPFFLFAPQPLASIAAGIIIFTQLWLVATGNFAWLNWIPIVLAFSAISDSVLHSLVPAIPLDLYPAEQLSAAAGVSDTPLWWLIIVLAASLLLVVLSYWPIRNLFAHRQLMNASFNR